MADTMTPEQRSRCMSKIKGRDTKPEIMVRKYLFSQGLRFRVNVATLPGKPDVVLPKYHVVIFINGCFWHGHSDCRYATIPKSNTDFWLSKINRNRARDLEVEEQLIAKGWKVIRIWECSLKSKYRQETLSSLLSMIIDTHRDDAPSMAAEPEIPYGK